MARAPLLLSFRVVLLLSFPQLAGGNPSCFFFVLLGGWGREEGQWKDGQQKDGQRKDGFPITNVGNDGGGMDSRLPMSGMTEGRYNGAGATLAVIPRRSPSVIPAIGRRESILLFLCPVGGWGHGRKGNGRMGDRRMDSRLLMSGMTEGESGNDGGGKPGFPRRRPWLERRAGMTYIAR